MLEDLTDVSAVDLSEVKNPNGGSTGGYDNFQRQNQQQNHDQQQRNNQSNNWSNNNQQQQQTQQQGQGNNWQQNKQNNWQGGGKQNNWQGGNKSGGGQGNWNKKEEVIEEPYVPVTVYIDRDFPSEVKQQLIALASRLINKNIVVRYNADDLEVHTALSGISKLKTEAYTPWKAFNNVDTKHYFNTETSKHIASSNFSGWEKIPDAVKAMLARTVRMVFGDKNRSPTMCLITWSPDGASRALEVTKDTGRAGFVIKLASTYGFSVVNIAKPNSESILEKAFSL